MLQTSLFDCCGLVVHLLLGLLVAHHFDLSGRAESVFIPFKGPSKKKQNKKNINTIKKFFFFFFKGKKENDRVQMIQIFYKVQQQTCNTEIISIIT